MLVVIPFYAGDVARAVKNLEWCLELDGKTSHPCLLTYEIGTSTDQILPLARKFFPKVDSYRYDKFEGDKSWPQPQNWAWQTTARYIYGKYREAWFWWESDITPIKPGWIDTIYAEHLKGGKAFTGHIVEKMGHLNGGCILPWNVQDYSSMAMITRRAAWDVVAGRDIMGEVHKANHLFQHKWEVDGHPATFPTLKELDTILDPDVVLFHRCKDGTLIDRLREKKGGIIPAIEKVKENGQSVMQAAGSFFRNLIPVVEKKEIREKWVMPPGQLSRKKKGELFHLVERHTQEDPDDRRRTLNALDSWLALYKEGKMKPVHFWKYPRTSDSLGDYRRLPFLKDLLVEGITVAQDKDWLVLTNDDTILHPKVADLILDLPAGVEAVSSFRIEFDRGRKIGIHMDPAELAKLYNKDLGRDLFAFTAGWIKEHWFEIPDYLLGEQEWDLVMTFLIREGMGIRTNVDNILETIPNAELPLGYLLHERHVRKWTQVPEENPAKEWNRNLTREWCKAHGYEYPIRAPDRVIYDKARTVYESRLTLPLAFQVLPN